MRPGRSGIQLADLRHFGRDGPRVHMQSSGSSAIGSPHCARSRVARIGSMGSQAPILRDGLMPFRGISLKCDAYRSPIQEPSSSEPHCSADLQKWEPPATPGRFGRCLSVLRRLWSRRYPPTPRDRYITSAVDALQHQVEVDAAIRTGFVIQTLGDAVEGRLGEHPDNRCLLGHVGLRRVAHGLPLRRVEFLVECLEHLLELVIRPAHAV